MNQPGESTSPNVDPFYDAPQLGQKAFSLVDQWPVIEESGVALNGYESLKQRYGEQRPAGGALVMTPYARTLPDGTRIRALRFWRQQPDGAIVEIAGSRGNQADMSLSIRGPAVFTVAPDGTTASPTPASSTSYSFRKGPDGAVSVLVEDKTDSEAAASDVALPHLSPTANQPVGGAVLASRLRPMSDLEESLLRTTVLKLESEADNLGEHPLMS